MQDPADVPLTGKTDLKEFMPTLAERFSAPGAEPAAAWAGST